MDRDRQRVSLPEVSFKHQIGEELLVVNGLSELHEDVLSVVHELPAGVAETEEASRDELEQLKQLHHAEDRVGRQGEDVVLETRVEDLVLQKRQ